MLLLPCVRLAKHDAEVVIDCMISVPNFVNFGKVVRELNWWAHRHTWTQRWSRKNAFLQWRILRLKILFRCLRTGNSRLRPFLSVTRQMSTQQTANVGYDPQVRAMRNSNAKALLCEEKQIIYKHANVSEITARSGKTNTSCNSDFFVEWSRQ
jgi:hypothetical protein